MVLFSFSSSWLLSPQKCQITKCRSTFNTLAAVHGANLSTNLISSFIRSRTQERSSSQRGKAHVLQAPVVAAIRIAFTRWRTNSAILRGIGNLSIGQHRIRSRAIIACQITRYKIGCEFDRQLSLTSEIVTLVEFDTDAFFLSFDLIPSNERFCTARHELDP